MNTQLLIGNLASDPILTESSSGTQICKFRVITSESYTKADGEKIERTDGHNIVAFRRLAEVCAQYLAKGRKVYVSGRTEHDKYERDGETKYWTSVVADKVEFLSSVEDPANGNMKADPEPSFDPAEFADV